MVYPIYGQVKSAPYKQMIHGEEKSAPVRAEDETANKEAPPTATAEIDRTFSRSENYHDIRGGVPITVRYTEGAEVFVRVEYENLYARREGKRYKKLELTQSREENGMTVVTTLYIPDSSAGAVPPDWPSDQSPSPMPGVNIQVVQVTQGPYGESHEVIAERHLGWVFEEPGL